MKSPFIFNNNRQHQVNGRSRLRLTFIMVVFMTFGFVYIQHSKLIMPTLLLTNEELEDQKMMLVKQQQASKTMKESSSSSSSSSVEATSTTTMTTMGLSSSLKINDSTLTSAVVAAAAPPPTTVIAKTKVQPQPEVVIVVLDPTRAKTARKSAENRNNDDKDETKKKINKMTINNNSGINNNNTIQNTSSSSSSKPTALLMPHLSPPQHEESATAIATAAAAATTVSNIILDSRNSNNKTTTTNSTTTTTTTTVSSSSSSSAATEVSSSTTLFNVTTTTTTAMLESKLQAYDITKLPNWMIKYFQWHNRQLLEINSTNWTTQKYLIMRCTQFDTTCGGTSDRLKALPVLLYQSLKTQRLLFIYWDRPCHLEEFLMPTQNFNFTLPHYMIDAVSSKQLKQTKFKDIPLKAKSTIIITKIQRQDGGESFLKDMLLSSHNNSVIVNQSDYTYKKFYHDMFRYVFQMSSGLSNVVLKQMFTSGLIPGNYNVVHYRAFYAISKDTVSLDKLKLLSENAINCATQLMIIGSGRDRQQQPLIPPPPPKLYFASDSNKAMVFAKEYATSKNLTLVKRPSKPPNNNNDNEPLHLDVASRISGKNSTIRHPIEAYYDSFVDLIIMGNGQCVTYGKGGFGKFASLLSFVPSCSNTHYDKSYDQTGKWRNRGGNGKCDFNSDIY